LVKINPADSNVALTNGNPKDDIPPIPNEVTLPNPRNFSQPHRNRGTHVMPRVPNNQRYVPDAPKMRHQIKINHPSPATYGKASANNVISSARPLVGHRRRSGLRGGVKSKGKGFRWIPSIRGLPPAPVFRAQPIPTPPPMYQPGEDIFTFAVDPETNVGNPDYEYQDNFEEDNFDEGDFGGFEDDNRATDLYSSDDRYPFEYK